MKAEDVKTGMKVVPHDKTVCPPLSDSVVWKEAQSKNQPYLFTATVGPYGSEFVLGCKENTDSGDYFNASDFEPYREHKKQKFGGYFEGSKTVVYVNGKKGEANCSPDDTYSAPYGLLLAYCRATNTDTTIVDMLFKKPEDKPAEPVTFEVGETVKVRCEIPDDLHSIPLDDYKKCIGKCFKIIRTGGHPPYRLNASIACGTDWWFHGSMLEKVPQPVKENPLEVVINGVKYVREETK